jgi:predicted dehydrogenase
MDKLGAPSGGSVRLEIHILCWLPLTRVQGNFNVVFVGAGNIMFDSPEGPWNHSFRFEHKLGPRLKVIALIDPAIERAHAALKKKCESFVVSAYQDTRGPSAPSFTVQPVALTRWYAVFKNMDDYVAAMANAPPREQPQAFVIGSPPMFRGTTQPGRDTEMQIMKHFPGIPLFVEKPITTGAKEEISEAFKVARAVSESRTICSVGYMLRYLKAVQMMKQILIDEDLQVMSTVARYACAYEAIEKPDWWDKSKRYGLCLVTEGKR